MYRKRNGSLGFSFTRFANAAVPNFFEDPLPKTNYNTAQYRRDMCYSHQIASPSNIYALDERSFYVAGIVDTEGMSRKVYKALRKHEILKPDDSNGGVNSEKGGLVDTYKIGPRFAHQIAVINMARQRELVDMLFWWEEECHRLKKLEDEEKDLSQMIRSLQSEIKADQQQNQDASMREDDMSVDPAKKQMLDQLKFARERIRMKRRQSPSQRRPDVENDTDDLHMAFHGRSKSAPQIQTPGQNVRVATDDKPPDYYYR